MAWSSGRFVRRAGAILAGGLVLALGHATAHGSDDRPTTAPAGDLPAGVPPADAARAARREEWFVIELMGERAGWMHTVEESRGGRIESRGDSQISIKRGPASIDVRMETRSVETSAGEMVSMMSMQRLGTMPVKQIYEFSKEGVKVTSVQAGKATVTNREKLAGEFLAPAAAHKAMVEQVASGREEFEIRSIDASSGLQIATSKYRVVERTTLEHAGHPVAVTKLAVETSIAPGVVTTEYVDAQGRSLMSETSLGGIAMRVVASTREQAQRESDAPELMVRTFVTPTGEKIERPRELRRARYTLSIVGGKLPDVPSGGHQTFTRVDDASGTLEVDLAGVVPAGEGDREDPRYSESSSLINFQDEEVQALLARAKIPDAAAPAERGEALRRFVSRHISKKSLGVGFASAGEVARGREGDCSEHGVLLAALLRASGIPARVCSGLIYADQFAGQRAIFGYHMWAQALIAIDGQDRWVDLDATLPDASPTDATHIALAASALGEGELSTSFTSLLPVMGKLQIRVDEAGHTAP